jgi:hypothetical protein
MYTGHTREKHVREAALAALLECELSLVVAGETGRAEGQSLCLVRADVVE